MVVAIAMILDIILMMSACKNSTGDNQPVTNNPTVNNPETQVTDSPENSGNEQKPTAASTENQGNNTTTSTENQGNNTAAPTENPDNNNPDNNGPDTVTGTDGGDMIDTNIAILNIRVGDEFFSVDLEGNLSAEAFFDKVRHGELKVEMHDFGGFEKVGYLPWTLPTSDESITTKPGDLILYQGNQITVYYGENTWEFTKLGHLNAEPEEILEVFGGKDDITAEFFLDWTE